MKDDKFKEYCLTNIKRLFPDVADTDGHRVILKCDSGPGRMNLSLIFKLRAAGFLLYPCVPNTTAVTQETDISFGLFKHLFHKNLNQLTDNRLERNVNVTFTLVVIGL